MTLSPSPDTATTISESLRRALDLASRSGRLLVATDFDGTISPLVDDPLAARAHPRAVDALTRISAAPNTSVAIVTGRPLNVLDTLLPEHEQFDLIASHGAEHRYLPRPHHITPFGEDGGEEHDQLREDLLRELAQIVRERPGTFVEPKPHGGALHTRMASPEDRESATSLAMELGHTYPAAHVMTGNNIVEFSTSPATKGEALTHLAHHIDAEAVIYLGDDVTDETAFRALTDRPGSVTIKVGSAQTAARHRVATIDDVCSVLETLAEGRHA